MLRVCTICQNKKRPAIDKALATGTAIPAISREYCVSEDALMRHKSNHLTRAIQKAAEKREEAIGETALSRLEKLADRAERFLIRSEASDNGRLTLGAIRELREILTSIHNAVSKAKTQEGQTIIFNVQPLSPSGTTLESARRPGDPFIVSTIIPKLPE